MTADRFPFLLRPGNFFKIFFLSLLLSATLKTFAQTTVFAQLQGVPINTSGWNLTGSARIGNISGNGNGEIILASNQPNQSGAIFCSQRINFTLCNKWIAEFDFRIADGSKADGLTFCFLDVPPTGFVGGGGMGIPASANGLKICFDSYANCSGNQASFPKIEMRWGVGYDECAVQPTVDNSTGSLNFIRSGSYNHARITYDAGTINVYINNTLFLTGFQQFGISGYFGFTAATGANTDNHSIKNVSIYTDMPPSKAGNNATLCYGGTLQIGSAPVAGVTTLWTVSYPPCC